MFKCANAFLCVVWFEMFVLRCGLCVGLCCCVSYGLVVICGIVWLDRSDLLGFVSGFGLSCL